MIRILKSIEEIIKRVHDRDAPPIAIKFHATWCKPCKESAPWFDALVKKFPEMEFASVDIDDVEAALAVYGVKTIPAVHVWYRGGRAAVFGNRDEFGGVEPLLVHLRDHNPAIGYANQCSLEVAHVNSSDHGDAPIGASAERLVNAAVVADMTPINFGLGNDRDKTVPAVVNATALVIKPPVPSKSEKRRRE